MTTLTPLQQKHRAIMRAHGLVNCKAAIIAREKVDIPLPAACANLAMESGGKNIYGHDPGGAMSFPGKDVRVTEANYKTFRHLVIDLHHLSNGVGPCQITYSGYFPQMEVEGLKPWVPQDNMIKGFEILKSHYQASHGDWRLAAQAYNGTGAAAVGYGQHFMSLLDMWSRLLDG